MPHHHHVDATTISHELNTISSALNFMTEADLFVQLNAIAAFRNLPTPFLITAASSLITQANSELSSLPNSSALTSALNFALAEDINTGTVDRTTATTVVNALNGVLRLPGGSLFEFATPQTFMNAGATDAAVDKDPQIRQQLATDWNQPLNLGATELNNLLGDFLHYRFNGFSQTTAIAATINDIQNNHVV